MKISPGSEGVESPDFTAIEIPVRVLSSGDFWLTSATGSILLIAYYKKYGFQDYLFRKWGSDQIFSESTENFIFGV